MPSGIYFIFRAFKAALTELQAFKRRKIVIGENKNDSRTTKIHQFLALNINISFKNFISA